MECKLCDFACKYQSQYDNHIVSKMHIKLISFQERLEDERKDFKKKLEEANLEKEHFKKKLEEANEREENVTKEIKFLKGKRMRGDDDEFDFSKSKTLDEKLQVSVQPNFENISSIIAENTYQNQLFTSDSSFKLESFLEPKSEHLFDISKDIAFKEPIMAKNNGRICRIKGCLNIVSINMSNWKKCKDHMIKHKKKYCMFCDKEFSEQNIKQHYQSCSTKILEEDPFLKRQKNNHRYYCPNCCACLLKRNFSNHIDTCKDSRFNKEICKKCNRLVVLNANYVFGSKNKAHQHVCKVADFNKKQCPKCKKHILIDKYDNHIKINKCFRPRLRNITKFKNGSKKYRPKKLHKCNFCKIETLFSKRFRHLSKCKIFRVYLVVGKHFMATYLVNKKYKAEHINNLFKEKNYDLSNNLVQKIQKKEELIALAKKEIQNPGLIDRNRLRPEITVESIINGEYYDYQGNKHIDEECKFDVEKEIKNHCTPVRKSYIKKPTKSISFVNNLMHYSNIDLIMNEEYRKKKNYIEDMKTGLPTEYLDALEENGYCEFMHINIVFM